MSDHDNIPHKLNMVHSKINMWCAIICAVIWIPCALTWYMQCTQNISVVGTVNKATVENGQSVLDVEYLYNQTKYTSRMVLPQTTAYDTVRSIELHLDKNKPNEPKIRANCNGFIASIVLLLVIVLVTGAHYYASTKSREYSTIMGMEHMGRVVGARGLY